MSRCFCSTPQLCLLEQQMQQPPGYRPRGKGIYIVDELDWRERGNYTKIMDCIISRVQMEQLRSRIQDIFGGTEREKLFRDEMHCNTFRFLMDGRRGKQISTVSSYAAALYLLVADELLWDKVGGFVLDTAIGYDRIRLGHVTLEQYILFHASKDVYQSTKHIRLSELVDRELISDEMLLLIVNAFVIEKFGVNIIWEAWNENKNIW